MAPSSALAPPAPLLLLLFLLLLLPALLLNLFFLVLLLSFDPTYPAAHWPRRCEITPRSTQWSFKLREAKL